MFRRIKTGTINQRRGGVMGEEGGYVHNVGINKGEKDLIIKL